MIDAEDEVGAVLDAMYQACHPRVVDGATTRRPNHLMAAPVMAVRYVYHGLYANQPDRGHVEALISRLQDAVAALKVAA